MPKVFKSSYKGRASSSTTSPFRDRLSPSTSHTHHRNSSTWTAGDDETLTSARAAGKNWQDIASHHFPSKTANACRKRHERLSERRSEDEWDEEKLGELATAYYDCRAEMWSMLADRMGERWSTVEAKVGVILTAQTNGFPTLTCMTVLRKRNEESTKACASGSKKEITSSR